MSGSPTMSAAAAYIETTPITTLYLRIEQADPLAIFSLETGATAGEVKAAYRALALRIHPDKCSLAKRALHTKLFQRVNDAYKALQMGTTATTGIVPDSDIVVSADHYLAESWETLHARNEAFRDNLRARREVAVNEARARKEELRGWRERYLEKQTRLREQGKFIKREFDVQHEKAHQSAERPVEKATARGPKAIERERTLRDALFAKKIGDVEAAGMRRAMELKAVVHKHETKEDLEGVSEAVERAKSFSKKQKKVEKMARRAKGVSSEQVSSMPSTKPTIAPSKAIPANGRSLKKFAASIRPPPVLSKEERKKTEAKSCSDKRGVPQNKPTERTADLNTSLDNGIIDMLAPDESLLRARTGNFSIADGAFKRRAEAARLAAAAEAFTAAHQNALDQGLHKDDDILAAAEAARSLAYISTLERPLPHEDIQIWHESAKYIWNADEGTTCTENPDWVYAPHATARLYGLSEKEVSVREKLIQNAKGRQQHEQQQPTPAIKSSTEKQPRENKEDHQHALSSSPPLPTVTSEPYRSPIAPLSSAGKFWQSAGAAVRTAGMVVRRAEEETPQGH